mgnify:CR=1 FL=1
MLIRKTLLESQKDFGRLEELQKIPNEKLFELLNARLSEKADNLQIAEEQIFRLYALFQNATFDGEINYPDSFNIRDYASDLIYFQQAKAMNIGSPTFEKEVDKEIARAVVDDDAKLNIIFDEIDTKPEVGEFTQDEVEKETVEEETIITLIKESILFLDMKSYL